MKILRPADYCEMAWKNGLGTTTEIYRADGPGGALDWRVSIAGVASDGPFSPFEGYDRHIMTIEGEGMSLEGTPDGPLAVHPAFMPVRFSGDWPITAVLKRGPVRDFNLIVRRESFESDLSCTLLSRVWQVDDDDSQRLVHVLSGTILVNDTRLYPAWSVIISAGEAPSLQPADGAARLAICTICPKRPQ